jgi:hypothetical protein
LPGDGSFREELSRPWAQPRLRWIPRFGDPPIRQTEREFLLDSTTKQEMEEDDDAQSHDENQRRWKQRTTAAAQQCRAMDLEREEE